MSSGLIWNPKTGLFETVEPENNSVSAYDYFSGMLPQQDAANPQISSIACVHEWKEYYGLRESYKYCSKCDYKKDI